MSKVRFDYGGGWRPALGQLVPAGGLNPRPDLPWDDSYAAEVFRGEHPLSEGFGGLPPDCPFVVLKRVDEVPVAVATFENAGHVVGVEFLNDDYYDELKYIFTDHQPETTLSPDGVQRPGSLFLAHIALRGYGPGLDQYGAPRPIRLLQRLNRNTGMSSVSESQRDPAQPYEGPLEEELDVSGDGFWEPVATFGDWDRWFVRDRPGVKLFD